MPPCTHQCREFRHNGSIARFRVDDDSCGEQFKELGRVIQEGEGDDGHDVPPGGPFVRDRVERMTDDEVAFHGDGQRGVDGASEGDLSQGQGSRKDMEMRPTCCVAFTNLFMEAYQWE